MNPADLYLGFDLKGLLFAIGATVLVIGVIAVVLKSFTLALRYWWVSIPLYGAWADGFEGFILGVTLVIVLKIVIFVLMIPFKLLSIKNSGKGDGQ